MKHDGQCVAAAEFKRPLGVSELMLATPHAPDFVSFGLTIDQLTATNAKYYVQTARWAEAIHANHMHVEGLEWTSYRASPARACVLFGDWVGSAELVPSGNEALIATDAVLFDLVIQCGERAGVRVHRSTLLSSAR